MKTKSVSSGEKNTAVSVRHCSPAAKAEVIPAIKDHCECNFDASENMNPSSWYSEEEQIGIRHLPNECKCVAGLAQFMRDGRVLTLCSCCDGIVDQRIPSAQSQAAEAPASPVREKQEPN